MGDQRPKQYLPLKGRPLIHHALATLCAAQAVRRVFVILAVGDLEWDRHDWTPLGPKLQPLFCGGPTRADTVLSGLRAIGGEVEPLDWVLVHDAARPCLSAYHLDKLLWEVGDNEVGGILATPVADTLKRSEDGAHIVQTVPRAGLWQAQTPQMFHYHVLRQALERSREVTDEASAVEAMGLRPKLVASDALNLKVTYPLDLRIAEWILANREE